MNQVKCRNCRRRWMFGGNFQIISHLCPPCIADSVPVLGKAEQ